MSPIKRPFWPTDPNWRRKIAIRLSSAFVFVLLLDLASPYLKADRIVGMLRAVTASLDYAGRSLAIGTAVEMVTTRLTADRYHVSVRNLRAPFNLSDACFTGRAATYGLSGLCAGAGPGPFRGIFAPPSNSRMVDPDKYPRRWHERLIGIPDAAISVGRCAWNGRDACLPPRASRVPPSAWLSRFVMVAVLMWALAMTLYVGATTPTDVPSGVMNNLIAYVLMFVVCTGAVLLYAGAAMQIIGSGVLLMTEIGLWVATLTGALLTTVAARPLLWALAAVKDVAADRAKDVIGRGLGAGSGPVDLRPKT